MSNAITLNNVVLMGRMTHDPELRHTRDNTPVCSFQLAVARGSKSDGDPNFIPCIAWRQQAEFLSQWCSKGTLLIIIGQLNTRIWKDEYGKTRLSVEVWCDKVSFGETKRQRISREADKPAAPSAPDTADNDGYSDLRITAIHAQDGEVLEGALYKLSRADGTLIQDNIAYNAADHSAQVCGLPAGEYQIIEIRAPEGYRPVRPAIFVTLEPGMQHSVSFPNEIQQTVPDTPQPQEDFLPETFYCPDNPF